MINSEAVTQCLLPDSFLSAPGINPQDFLPSVAFDNKVMTLIITRRINKDPECVCNVRMTLGIQSANPVDSAVVRAGIYHPLTRFD